MRFLVILILIITIRSYGQIAPCEDGKCDNMAVRAILDSNGLTDVRVDNVVERDTSGRVIYLDIDRKKLTRLPPEIGLLSRLLRLSLYYNQLTSLPPEIGQLSALNVLLVEYNELVNVPPEVGLLSQLKILGFCNNALTGLPPEIGRLSNLYALQLYYNRITSLPPEIGQLANLKKLVINNNQLDNLPPEIINLKLMVGLDINHNYLCTLPDSIETWVSTFSDSGNWREKQKQSDTIPCDSTGIQKPPIKSLQKEITIRHQPSRNSIEIVFMPSSTEKDVFIYTLKGRLVKKLRTDKNRLKLNTQGYTCGVFFIRVIFDGKRFVRKVLL